MFIVWGTKRRERRSGRVADYCPICDNARACQLIEVRMVSHLYYIPLGRGEVTGHLLRCEQCKHITGTDPQHYTSVSKNRRASVEELTDTTHPQLIESMAKWLDLRDRAERGEMDEDERHRLIRHPFESILAPVAKRCGGIHLDGRSLGWLLVLMVVPVLVLSACASINAKWMTDEMELGLVLVSIFIISMLLIISIGRDASRFIRKRYWRFFVEFLAPLNPTVEEIRNVVLKLKHSHETAEVGKRIIPDKLHQDITIYREDRMLQGSPTELS